jgi:signal peptidase I
LSAKKQKSVVREYVEAILIALLLALFIRTFVVQAFKIPSGSMIPTLLVGDHILVNKFIYGIRNPFSGTVLIPIDKPARNDVIVFKYPKNPDQDYIKRIIGLEGDRIQLINKKIYINGEPFADKYGVFKDPNISSLPPRDNFGPIVVPKNSLFMMGDNRDNSADSRYWGFVDLKAVKGKAFMIYWSWDADKFNWDLHDIFPVRWNRIGHLIH